MGGERRKRGVCGSHSNTSSIIVSGHKTTESQSLHSGMSPCGFSDGLLVRRQIHTGYIAVKALSVPALSALTGHKSNSLPKTSSCGIETDC